MRGTELLFESSALASEPGRARLASVLDKLFRTFEINGPAILDGAGILVPAEPVAVFRALQAIDSHWYRLFALVPSESLLAREAAQIERPLTITAR